MVDRLKEYIAVVQEQVRWKRARAGLAEELYTHLLDQRDACLAEGMSEEEAQQESMRQMGDPVEVGTQLDRVHRPKPQWGLLLLVSVLLAMGYGAQTLMREVALSEPYITSAVYFEFRWAISALIGIIVLLVVYFLDYTILARRPLVCCCAGFLTLVGIFCSSHTFQGRFHEIQFWILFAPVLLALLIFGMRGKGWLGYVVCMGGSAVFAYMALLIPRMLIALLSLSAGVFMTMVAVWRGWLKIPKKKATLVTCVLLLLSLAGVLGSGSPYLSNRIQIAFHPESDPLGAGYQAVVIRSLLKGAKWIGQGDVTFMESRSAQEILPEIPTTTLLTWVIHRLGWLAGLILIGTLVFLLLWMARKAVRQRGMLAFLLSVAVVLALAVQVVSFVAFNLGFQLFGTISLPLISYGGRAMVVNMALIGLALSVFREEQISVKEQMSDRRKMSTEQMPLIFWRDGDLVIGLSRLRKAKL